MRGRCSCSSNGICSPIHKRRPRPFPGYPNIPSYLRFSQVLSRPLTPRAKSRWRNKCCPLRPRPPVRQRRIDSANAIKVLGQQLGLLRTSHHLTAKARHSCATNSLRSIASARRTVKNASAHQSSPASYRRTSHALSHPTWSKMRASRAPAADRQAALPGVRCRRALAGIERLRARSDPAPATLPAQ